MTDNDQTAGRHFAALIGRLEHPTALLDAQSRVVHWNAPFEKSVNRVLGLAQGQPLYTKISGDDCQAFRDFLEDEGPATKIRLLTEGKVIQLTISSLTKSPDPPTYLCEVSLADAKRLQYLMDDMDQGVWDYDVATNSFTVSAGWRRIRGIKPGFGVYDPGYNWIEDIHPDDRDTLKRTFIALVRGDETQMRIEYRHRKGKDDWVWILGSSKVVDLAPDGTPTRIVGTDTDITALKNREAELEHLKRKLQLALDASGIGVFEFDPNHNTVHWDDRLLEIYGIPDQPNDRSGHAWETHLHPEDAEAAVAYAEECEASERDTQLEFRIVRPDGEIRHIRSLAGRMTIPEGRPKLVGVNIDMTEDVRRAEELEKVKAQLEHDSRHDALTGLANRRLLDESTAVLPKRLCKDDRYAVLHLDLDHFKIVNDTLGHAAGDAVLVHVAKVIQSIVGEDGLTCRVGGDEFAILFPHAPDEAGLMNICERIVAQVREPFLQDDVTCKIGISIGVAYGLVPFADVTEVFKNADQALYAAKEAGRNCYRLYDPSWA